MKNRDEARRERRAEAIWTAAVALLFGLVFLLGFAFSTALAACAW